MAKKIDIHKYIAVFLIIIGLLPFVGVSMSGTISDLANILVIVSGVIILITK